MNFRIFATVEHVTPSGNAFPFVVWAGEFCDSKYSRATAKQYARRKAKKSNPSVAKFDLAVELIPEYDSYH